MTRSGMAALPLRTLAPSSTTPCAATASRCRSRCAREKSLRSRIMCADACCAARPRRSSANTLRVRTAQTSNVSAPLLPNCCRNKRRPRQAGKNSRRSRPCMGTRAAINAYSCRFKRSSRHYALAPISSVIRYAYTTIEEKTTRVQLIGPRLDTSSSRFISFTEDMPSIAMSRLISSRRRPAAWRTPASPAIDAA